MGRASRKLCRFLLMFLTDFTLLNVLFLFPLLITSFIFMCGVVFYSISANINEVLSINPSAVFVFGDFNVHNKDWLTYSRGTDRLELCYKFSISSNLTQMVNIPTQIPDYNFQSYSSRFIYFF